METTRSLFYQRGIQTTGVGELAEVAGVSKRTLYQLFDSKDELVAEYLRQTSERGLSDEYILCRDDIPPRERLLGLFERPRLSAGFRGCPFHNAAVEFSDPGHPARAVVIAHKRKLQGMIVEVARAVGAKDPELLGGQLLTLMEGASGLATSLDDAEPFDFARSVAVMLIDQSVGT